MKRFENKKALIFGGNSGIGLATAKALAAEGATVAITGRNAATLRAAEGEIAGLVAIESDIADIAATEAAVAHAGEALGKIDILFINAGIGTFAAVREVTPDLWDHVHGVNLRGCFFAAQRSLPLMRRGGTILFTGSVGSVLGVPGNLVYGSAKAGLRQVARILAAELVGDGIRVNMVSPGPTETPILGRNIGMATGEIDTLRRHMTEAVPMKRMGTAEEIAKAVLFLASDDASFITGIDLFVDGGCVEL